MPVNVMVLKMSSAESTCLPESMCFYQFISIRHSWHTSRRRGYREWRLGERERKRGRAKWKRERASERDERSKWWIVDEMLAGRAEKGKAILFYSPPPLLFPVWWVVCKPPSPRWCIWLSLFCPSHLPTFFHSDTVVFCNSKSVALLLSFNLWCSYFFIDLWYQGCEGYMGKY